MDYLIRSTFFWLVISDLLASKKMESRLVKGGILMMLKGSAKLVGSQISYFSLFVTLTSPTKSSFIKNWIVYVWLLYVEKFLFFV